ncbi:MAG: protein kinase [Planctomycetaceae bacterium]
MNQPACCPQCQKPLGSDAPLGLCPSCLLGAAAMAPALSPAKVESPQGIPSLSSLERFLSPTTPSLYRFVPPNPQELAPFFPALEILELIGFGGMGAVYKARQIKLDRLVALKIIRPEAQADPAFAERFNREARTLARLSHPGIVAIHDFGEVSGDITGAAPLYYFVMEYVDGTNLRQLLRAPMEPTQALTVIPQVCDALQYAHQEGVVHRDIKPENILIDARGRVKIADFGLARVVVGSAEEWTLTGTHQVMGTPRYMAPEQMEGSHSVDHRADIYSLGVVFYEMLTGQIPAGHFEPPSRKANVHPGLDSIVLRAMAREPERRFQSISELRVQVEKLASSPAAFTAVKGGTGGDAFFGTSDDQSDDSYANASGMSAIMSREALAAMRWVAGPTTERTASRAPRWLMLLLALIPCAMLFFPWLDVYVTDNQATRGMPEQFKEIYNNLPARHLQFIPIQMASGINFIVFMVFVIVIQAVSLGQHRPMVRLALPGLLFTALAILFLMIHRSEISYQFVPVYADPVTGAPPQSHMSYSNGEGRAFVGSLAHEVVYRQPFYATFACCIILLVFSASEVRHSFALMLRKRAELRAKDGGRPDPVEVRAGRYLLILSVLMFISGGITFTIMLDVGDFKDDVMYFFAGLQVACLPVTILGLLAGFTLKQQHVTQIVHIALILLLLPLTPASVISIPIAAWCLAALKNRSHGSPVVQNAGGIPAAASAPDAAKRLRFAFITAGILLMVTTVLFFLVSFMAASVAVRVPANETRVAPAWGPLILALGTLLFTLSLGLWSLIAAGSVRRGASNVMAYRVATAYLLPITPAWPITFFIGLHCRKLLEELQNETSGPFGPAGAGQAAGTLNGVTPHGNAGATSSESGAQRTAKTDNRYWQRRGLQAAFVVSLLMFLTISTDFSTGTYENGIVLSRSQVTRVGLPEPWFVSETLYDANGVSTHHQFRWLGHSLWLMIAGLVCYFVADRMAPADGTRRKRWILSPAAMTGMTLVLAIWMAFLSTWASTTGGVRNALLGDPRPELLQAVQNSDQPTVQRLLENGNTTDPPLPEGFNSPLWWAVAEDDPMITAMLLAYQADVNFSSKEGITPLMLAARKGDVATCGSLLNLGANVNAQDTIASSDQHTILTNSNAIYWPGARMTPLMLAAWNGHEPVAKLLLEHGADPMLRNASGRTAYEIAQVQNYYAIHNLILESIKPAVEIPAGESTSFAPAMPPEALDLMLAKALTEDNLDSVKAWKMSGGSVQRANSSGQTALMQAAAAGRERIAAWLMLAGSDPLQRDPTGQTPLMIAAAAGHARTVEMILRLEQIGVDEEIQFRMSQMASDLPGGLDFKRYHFDAGIDQTDSSGETAWMKAAAAGHLQAFEILTEMTVADKLTPDGKSWLSMAVENKQESLLCSLLDTATAQMEYLQKGTVSSSRITPDLMCLKDAANRNPLERARELGLSKVVEKMETYCQLLIKSMDQHLQESPNDQYATEVKAKCLKTLGQN